jgi:hypothetical protein
VATIGFVVLERNQAGGPLALPPDAWIYSREDAETVKATYEAHTAALGRRDRYVIATLEVAEDDRD